MTDEDRFTALLALGHQPLYCFVNDCVLCRAYFKILLTPTKNPTTTKKSIRELGTPEIPIDSRTASTPGVTRGA